MQHQDYRRDIDGLRAVAVMGVVLYHFGFGLLNAGYAGVDVFFVISGFLIGGIIIDERAAGRFTLRRFYARRIRRIVPALLVVMLACFAIGLVVMTPNELRYMGGAAASALLFVSNFWFLSRLDYFNPEAALDPLLHTWSLGVEEQFYLYIPLLMILLTRRGRLGWALPAGIALLALASFAMMLWQGPQDATVAFYMIWTRSWEMAVGVLAAVLVRRRALAPVPAGVMANLGLLLVLGSLVALPRGILWPSGWTLLPVGGAVLLLLGGPAPSAARWLLTRPPLVGIGLISYSLYLWHQPVHSFAVLTLRREDLPLPLLLGLLVATLALAWASWRYVEQPFRNGALARLPGRLVFGGAVVAVLALAVGGHVTQGYPQRMPAPAQQAMQAITAQTPDYWRCANRGLSEDGRAPEAPCEFGAPGVAPTIALWGDSHAATIAVSLGQALAADGLALRQFSLNACPPIAGIVNFDPRSRAPVRRAARCAGYVEGVLDQILADPALQTVVLYAFWSTYAENAPFDAGNGRVQPDRLYAVPVGAGWDVDETTRQAALDTGFARVVTRLLAAGRRVLVVQPLPEAPFEVPQTYAFALWKDRLTPADTGYPVAAFTAHTAQARRFLAAPAPHPDLHAIDLSGRLCSDGTCHLVGPDGVPWYIDSNHLSLSGAAQIIPDLATALRGIAQP